MTILLPHQPPMFLRMSQSSLMYGATREKDLNLQMMMMRRRIVERIDSFSKEEEVVHLKETLVAEDQETATVTPSSLSTLMTSAVATTT